MATLQRTSSEVFPAPLTDVVRSAVEATLKSLCGAKPEISRQAFAVAPCGGVVGLLAYIGDTLWSLALILPRETAPPDSQPKSPPADDPPVVTPAPGSDHAAQLAGVAIADEPPPASANNPAPDESPTRRVAGFRPENTAPSSDTPSAAVDTSTTPAPAASTFVVQASHWVKNLADRRPWFALLGLGLLLFSIGVNLFLTWVTWEARSQYRAIARRLRGNQYHVEPLS